MTDDRKFATAKMNKPKDSQGNSIGFVSLDDSTVKYRYTTNSKLSFRKLLYAFYIPLLLIDWTSTLLSNLLEIITNSIKELTLGLELFINNADSKPSEPEA